MATVEIKSLILMDRRRIRPETKEAIEAFLKSKDDVRVLVVDPTELGSFESHVVYLPAWRNKQDTTKPGKPAKES